MKVIGVTGGVGAGKSTILDYLASKHGARVVKADEVGHLVTSPLGSCYEQVISYFGRDIVLKDGSIDRKKLGQIVFADTSKLKMLNAIVHPAVKAYILAAIEQEKKLNTRYFIIEAALLLEDHYDEICDEIWYIYAKEEVRVNRLMEHRGYDRERCVNIVKNQMSEEEFRAYTHFELDNSCDVARTFLQIERRMKEYETL